jgi:hypothetical protein
MKATMDFVDVIMIAGICMMFGACAFLLPTALSAAKRARGQDLRLMDNHPGGRMDFYMSGFWGSMFLVQVSNVLRHVRPDGTYSLSLLALAATAGAIFVCGVYGGRLLLRREQRWVKEKREELSRRAPV